MPAKKERMAWILITLAAIFSTYMIMSKLYGSPQNQIGNSSPTATPSGIEQEADQWFTSDESHIPGRRFYTEITNPGPLLIYQDALEHKEPWTDYPEQIALRSFLPPPEIEGFVPSQTCIYFHDANIESVIITVISPAGLGAMEDRVDFVRVDNNWKIVWSGQRSIHLQ